MVKCLAAVQKTQVQSLGQEDPLEKAMATHSSILAWRILWTEEPGRLQSIGSQRVRHDWSGLACTHVCMHARTQYDCVLLRRRGNQHMDTTEGRQCEDTGEDGYLQATERGLGRNQPLILDFSLHNCGTITFLLFKAPSLNSTPAKQYSDVFIPGPGTSKHMLGKQRWML